MKLFESLGLPSTALSLVVVWLVTFLIAFLAGKVVAAPRAVIRRVVVPALLLSVLTATVEFLPSALIAGQPTRILNHAQWLMSGVFMINASGILAFVVVLPRFTSLSRIAHELSVGAAYVVLVLFFLRRFGVNFSSLLATSAVVTAIVAISMQATLGNAFGGLTLQLDQSIREGDWVRLDDGAEGRVRAVRWRHTVIETRNWDTIIMPNSLLMAQKFLLLGRREGEPPQHRMWVHFNVDFRYSPAEVIDAVQTGLRGAPIPGAATTPPPNCVCMDFVQPDSAIRYAVRYWLTDLAADDPTSSLVRERVFAALRRAKIPLAVPAATLFLENHDEEASERKAEKKFRRRLEAVKRMALSRMLTDEEQQHLARRLKFSPFASGEIISREGAPARWLYILDRGSVEVRVNHQGNDVTLNTLSAPNFFGEQGMLTGSPRAATVVAASEVECFRLDRETFDGFLQSRPEIADDLASVLAQRQQELAEFRAELDDQGDRVSRADLQSEILSRMQEFFGLKKTGD